MSTEAQRDDQGGAAAPASGIGEKKAGKVRWLLDILKHPLVLLVVGALLSSYLIPSWTRQWQNGQAELEAKLALVNFIDEEVGQMVTAVQFCMMKSASQSQGDYDEAYRRWEVERQIIRSRLQAYYPGAKLLLEWDALAADIGEFYARSDPTYRGGSEWEEYRENWWATRDELVRRKDELNRQILTTPMSIFH